MSKWTTQDIPNLNGKVVLITGANSGLGFECSKVFAQKGATVVMTARNLEKGEKAKAEVLQSAPDATVDLMQLDIGNLASIRDFVPAFKAAYDRLDILLNNAGVMAIPRSETPDGFEMQLGVNHLGHFALTGLLLDLIVKTPNARIHSVSSSAQYSGSINFDDLMGKQNYTRWGAYGQSKLANVVFTNELHKRLKAAGYDTIANASHPGIVYTNLQANSLEKSGNSLVERVLYRVIEPLMVQDISMGILPMLYGMTDPDAKSGVFYGPNTFNMRGYPAEKKSNKEAYDAAILNRFWEVSEQLTGITYDVLEGAPA